MGGEVLAEAVGNSLTQLCEELLMLKRSYFTPKGKPGWKPLTAETLRVKNWKNPATVTDFNTNTGKLRDSISVFWTKTATGARITVQSKDDNALIYYLTKTLGRDFLTIDDGEKQFIIDKFKKLLISNVTKR